jgi:dipeptidyl-peptidase-4
MRQLITLSFFLFVIAFAAKAQQKQFTMEQAVTGQFRELAPENLSALKWRPSTLEYTYVKADELLGVDAIKGTTIQIINLEKINAELEQQKIDKIRNLQLVSWVDQNTLSLYSPSHYIEINPKERQVTKSIALEKNAENFEIDPTRSVIAYTNENNLFIVAQNNLPVAITNDNNKGIVNGQSVHRNEFGIDKGIFWSPSGRMLAFYRMDETMVTDYPMVNITTRIAQVEPIKYPMAGMPSHHVTLGIYSIESGKTIWVKTGEPEEQYLTNISWSPNEKSIYIAIINRTQNHMWLNEYDAFSGNFVRTLFEEKHEKYVEPSNPIQFLKKQPNLFIWQSRKDGYNHLYLYKNDGSLVKQLTKGYGEVTNLYGTDAKEQYIYFSSTKESPLESHLYRVEIKTGKEQRLTQERGTHRVLLNLDKDHFLDLWSSTTIPLKIDLCKANGKLLKSIHSAPNPLSAYSIGEMNMVTLTANDGKTPLYGRLIKPVNFDPSKRYPVVVYVYGGPHTQLVTNSWLGGARLWEFYMAQKGYIMFTLDNRGSSNRGLEFENSIHRQLGVNELSDQIVGLNYLKSLPYVDSNRIGVHGWSYGGFMTISMMLKSDNSFKVGVAGGPVTDWSLYEIMYGERYMDTPEENPEGYSNANLKKYVKNLKGNLLLIHGDIDPTVVPQHSLNFIHECIKQGVQVDFFLYPRHEHNVRGRDRIHLMEKVTRYFDDFL